MRIYIATLLGASLLAAACAAQESAVEGRTITISTAGCSSEGGEVSARTVAGEIASWDLTLYSSNRATEVQLDDARTDRKSLRVKHVYHDGSAVEYSVLVVRRPDGFHPAGMVSIDFGDYLEDDISAISRIYDLTADYVAANRVGGQISCE